MWSDWFYEFCSQHKTTQSCLFFFYDVCSKLFILGQSHCLFHEIWDYLVLFTFCVFLLLCFAAWCTFFLFHPHTFRAHSIGPSVPWWLLLVVIPLSQFIFPASSFSPISLFPLPNYPVFIPCCLLTFSSSFMLYLPSGVVLCLENLEK